MSAMPIQSGDSRVWVTDQDNDVTTSVAGANGWETIFDLSPSTDIEYLLLNEDNPQLGSKGDLRIRMQLPQDGSGSTEVSDDFKIRLVARGPEQDTTGDRLGRVFFYQEFSQTNQFDSDDVVRLGLPEPVKITEAAHLEVQVNDPADTNDVDLSQSGGYLTVEAYRRTLS